jgi:hypothetical protein
MHDFGVTYRVSSVTERKEDIDAVLAQLKAEVLGAIEEDEKHELVRKPAHGNCCTCQTCGLPHDECREVEIEYNNAERQRIREAVKRLFE